MGNDTRNSCSLCSGPIDSILHLFFSCPIARVVWRQSFWHLDILAFNIADMTDWFSIILNPARIGIPLEDFHKFQIFAMVACDHIWFSRNKAHHEDWFLMLLLSLLILINWSRSIFWLGSPACLGSQRFGKNLDFLISKSKITLLFGTSFQFKQR
jgi:hypothetical protein